MKNFKAHILIVDDDDRIRDLVREYLSQNNYLVSTAKNSDDAYEKTKIIKFDLIVLDIMMPGKTGLEFTKDYKNKINTPILLLTAKGEPTERIEGLEVGADDYLTKPFEPKELILRINNILKINNTEKVILEKMINSPGKIFKREEIANLIDLNKERSIDVIVTRLRKKIEESPKNPKYLQTIRGEGYVLWIE